MLGVVGVYAAATEGKTSVFDAPLHYVFVDILNQNGPGDMRRLRFAVSVAILCCVSLLVARLTFPTL